MPEPPIIASLYLEATRTIGSYIESLPLSRELSLQEIAVYTKRDFCNGWEIPLAFSDARRRIHILTTAAFPIAPPRIALVDHPAFLTWPHVERDGVLCLLPSNATVSAERPVAVVQTLTGMAVALIEACITGSNTDDFAAEFNTYWDYQVTPGAKTCSSLLDINNRTDRKIALWRGKKRNIIAESAADIHSWLTNTDGRSRHDSCEEALLLWVTALPQPNQYPTKAHDIIPLLGSTPAILQEKVNEAPKEIEIIFASVTTNGVVFAGITIPKPKHTNAKGKTQDLLNKGFRPGHVPPAILSARYLNADTSIAPITVGITDETGTIIKSD